MSELNETILIVDDEFLIAQGLCVQVEEMGFAVCGTAATADDAVRMARAHRPMLILMDMRLRGEGDGVDAALAIHETVGSKMVFVTGSREPSTMARIQLDHPSAVLFKPVSSLKLHHTIRTALGMDIHETKA